MHVQAIIPEKTPITWVLVADGKQARIYECSIAGKRIPIGGSEGQTHYKETVARELLPIKDMVWEAESPKIYETGRNATGMVFESGSSARHMSEPRIDVREEIRQHLVKNIANKINKATAAKIFDRLIVVASAKILGELRASLSKETQKLVSAELPKDLTHCKEEELMKHLKNIV